MVDPIKLKTDMLTEFKSNQVFDFFFSYDLSTEDISTIRLHGVISFQFKIKLYLREIGSDEVQEIIPT